MEFYVPDVKPEDANDIIQKLTEDLDKKNERFSSRGYYEFYYNYDIIKEEVVLDIRQTSKVDAILNMYDPEKIFG